MEAASRVMTIFPLTEKKLNDENIISSRFYSLSNVCIKRRKQLEAMVWNSGHSSLETFSHSSRLTFAVQVIHLSRNVEAYKAYNQVIHPYGNHCLDKDNDFTPTAR